MKEMKEWIKAINELPVEWKVIMHSPAWRYVVIGPLPYVNVPDNWVVWVAT